MIVKRLSAIHDLGAMDVLCTDKTGTLTEATIKLAAHVDQAGEDSDEVLSLRLSQQPLRKRHEEPARRGDPSASVRSWQALGGRSTRCRSISSGGVFRSWSATPRRG